MQSFITNNMRLKLRNRFISLNIFQNNSIFVNVLFTFLYHCKKNFPAGKAVYRFWGIELEDFSALPLV